MLAPLEKLRKYLIDMPSVEKATRVCIFTSDAGFNALDLINMQDELNKSGQNPFEVSFLFSDNNDFHNYSNYFKGQSVFYQKINPVLADFDIRNLLLERNIPNATLDIDEFYISRGYKSKNDKSIPVEERSVLRNAYYEEVEKILSLYEKEKGPFDLIVNDTYLSVISGATLKRRIINCHFGDLTRINHGKRIYTGYHGFLHSMQNGERDLYSTVHYVNEFVDAGQIIMRSRPLRVDFQLAARYGFPFSGMTDDEVVAFLNNPDNIAKSIELEAFFEALIRLTVDPDTKSLATLAIAKQFFENGNLQDFIARHGIYDHESGYLSVI